MISAAQFDLLVGDRHVGVLTISALASISTILGQPVLVDLRGAVVDDGLEAVRLIEGAEYGYHIASAGGAILDVQPSELFDPDDVSASRGRLRTREWTGRLEIRVKLETGVCNPNSVEVRSVKLGYDKDYRSMLQAIARLGSELLLQRFAASAQRLSIDHARDAKTLYQRFAFLQALLRNDWLDTALRRIIAAPYVQWEETAESTTPQRGLRGGGRLMHQLTRPGRRVAWDDASVPLTSLPIAVEVGRSVETTDNIPNRFVKYALQQWIALVGDVRTRLEGEAQAAASRGKAPPAPVTRGLAETEELDAYLSEMVGAPMFADINTILVQFPESNQALQKRDGYREVLQTHLLLEFGSALAWSGGESVYSAGQRDVATLYEYWVFLELAQIVSDLCNGEKPDLTALIEEGASGLGLLLARGEARSVGGSIFRRGRTFDVALWFNQEFTPDGDNRSWTRAMRPDCSLALTHRGAADLHRVWLHFDAKYRMSDARGLSAGPEHVSVARDADLLKMHAYRDALFGAAGAYVVFPGNDETPPNRKRHEVLPSLGAFPLRPGGGDRAEGARNIRRFLEDVIDQLAEQASAYERSKYWEFVAYRDREPVATHVPWWSALETPAADTRVLVGFVDAEQQAWIDRAREFPLRADASDGATGVNACAIGGAYFLAINETSAVLYAVRNSLRAGTASELSARGCPSLVGKVFIILSLDGVEQPPWLNDAEFDGLRAACENADGPISPVSMCWRDLCVLIRTAV